MNKLEAVRFRILVLGVVGVLLLALAACGGMGAGGTDLTIGASEYAYVVPAEVEAGYVNVRLKNNGQEPHHAQLVRMNDGVTAEQFIGELAGGNEAALGMVTLEGGAGITPPGATSPVAISNLTAGNYAVMSFVPDAEGVPGFAKGMFAPFTVTGEGGGSVPEADAQVTLADFNITVPDDLAAGQVWQITNNGPQPHEMAIIRLAEGMSFNDVAAWFAAPDGPPPYEDVGGLQGIMPGATAYLDATFDPGTYVALCFIPDPATGQDHASLGMVQEFTLP